MKPLIISALFLFAFSAMADEGTFAGHSISEIENLKPSDNGNGLSFTLRKDGTPESVSCVEWGHGPWYGVYALQTIGSTKVWHSKLDIIDQSSNDKNSQSDMTMATCRAVVQNVISQFVNQPTDIVTNSEYEMSFVKRDHEALP
jgi:hypothetical protein